MPVTEITSMSQFSAAKTTKNKLILVDYYATWCGPCKAIAPAIDAMSSKYAQQCAFYKCDVDKCQDVARAEQITAMPTFKFYNGSTGQMVHEIKGANAAAIEQQIQTLSAQYTKTAFTGAGHTLNGPSTSSAHAQPAAASAAQPARRNPWADPAFAQKMVKKASEPVQPPPPAAASTASTDTAAAAGVAVDAALLKQLTDMGFPSVRAEKALQNTGNKDVESAMNWCLGHENDADIDTPSIAAAAAPAAAASTASTAATSTATAQPAAPAKPSKDELPADWDEMDEDDRIIYEELKKRNGPGAFKPTMNKEQREEVEKQKFADMTPEQRERWLAAKRAEVKAKREKDERQRAIDSEKSRQATHGAAQELKEKREKYEAEMMVAKKKREEAERIRVRNELRAKMAADKERRAREYEAGLKAAKEQKEKEAAMKAAAGK